MKTIFLKELKLNFKNLLIWSLAVGGMGLACILLYRSMQGEIAELGDAFSEMGFFSDAFGMSTLSMATLAGYFAVEVGTVHGLGGGMFAAIIAIGIISKEEEMHSGEFLLSLPVSRKKVVAAKGLCVICMLAAFTVICGALYALGFASMGESLPAKEFMIFMLGQFLMNIEIGAICFAISAISGKNRMGMGLGIALLCYFYDVIGRAVPDAKDYLFLGPYSYGNASEIFSGKNAPGAAFAVAAVMTACAVCFAFWYYNKRDLAS
ncbi:MAG: ABC transporter permease subunit [Lachnospiraceae bacterium]|nr:ABC transporter permease subunit [Lachnospiraceae bacterium]